MRKAIITVALVSIGFISACKFLQSKDWDGEISMLFADVREMHAKVLDTIVKSNVSQFDYTEARKIVNERAPKIKARYNEIMSASSWEISDSHKSVLRDKMLEHKYALMEMSPEQQNQIDANPELKRRAERLYQAYDDLFKVEDPKSAKSSSDDILDLTDEIVCSEIIARYEAKKYMVFITSLPSTRFPDPLMLVVTVSEDGNLKLNAQEMGKASDTARLTEELKRVFVERAQNSTDQRKVVVHFPVPDRVKRGMLENTIEAVAATGATPIGIAGGVRDEEKRRKDDE